MINRPIRIEFWLFPSVIERLTGLIVLILILLSLSTIKPQPVKHKGAVKFFQTITINMLKSLQRNLKNEKV